MASVPALQSPPSFQTLADVQAHLGGIPIHRIRLRPIPGEATEADLLALYESNGRVCELIDGVLVEKGMGVYESRVAVVLGYFLEDYRNVQDLGIVLGADAFMRLFPSQIRAPDVSFVSWKRLPGEEIPGDKIGRFVPDLAVEVLSEGNTHEEMDRKVQEYFDAGSKLVWLIDPETHTATVYTSPHRSARLTESDSLDGRKVLPGFSLPIKKLFARASRKRRK